MLSVEDWAEIRRLHRSEGMPIKVIARVMGCSKNTVKSAVRSTAPPRYERAPGGSVVDDVEPRIRELLQAWPTIPATVIAERIEWRYSVRVLRDRVAELRPVYLPPDPASRTSYLPGEIGQCDFWFPDIEIPVGFGQTRTTTRLPVLVMVTGYSRWLSARLLPSRAAEDLFAGWWTLISGLGGVPKTLVWDGEGAIGRWRRGTTELTRETHAFRGVLGAKVVICKPGDPEAKGLVERDNGYLETSFLPGRSFESPEDFNHQLTGWLPVANARRMRVLGCAPADRFEGPGRHAVAATGTTGDRLGTEPAAPPRPLHPPRQQRLLGAPGRGRSPGPGHRGSGPGPGVQPGPGRGRPCPMLGPAPKPDRPGPCPGGRHAAP